MLNFILKQNCTIAGDSTALMSGEELLANRTSEIIEEMTCHTMELTLVELMSTADSFLAEAEEALNGYTQVDPSTIYMFFHRHQSTVFEAGAVESHTQDNTVMLGFVMYDTEQYI